jgi:hypothetical protein
MKISVSIFLFFIVIFISTQSFATPSAHGVLMVVKGDVQVKQKDKTFKARVGQKIVQGDTIITGKDARAKLVMVDKNIINISPESRFVLEKYEYNPERDKKGALLNVIYGKVRTTVNQRYDGEQNKFQVKTKSSVAGVRGTDFLVSYNNVTNTSKIVTFQGLVEVGVGLDNAGRILNAVSVPPGQFTVASVGIPPSTPAPVPQFEMAALNEQSVADAPQSPTTNELPVDGDKKERAPSNQPQTPNNPGSVLNDMGEDVAAPVVGERGTASTPPPPLVPVGSQPPPCPTGQCGLPTTIDPTLTGGKTNLIIDIAPGN